MGRAFAAAAIGGAALAAALTAPGLVGGAATLHPRPAAARRPPSAPSPEEALRRAVDDDAPLPILDGSLAPPPEPAGRAGLMQGPMEAVLYGRRADLPPAAAAQALRLFAHKLDLTRDLALGDRVRMLLRADGALDYAELDGARGRMRLYRVAEGEEADAFVDDAGASLRTLLLRTPLDQPRLTSAFGSRLHPLLGYTRMHQGVDFGAAVGTPVLAAADGVVETAGWGGGYGRVLRLRHAGGLETVYAHLSGWPASISPGATVRQGQTVAWTGASGLVTGPHLHFEVRVAGAPVDPATAAALPRPVSPARLALAQARRREIDARLSRAEPGALSGPG